MDTQKRVHENISAMVDGELAASEIELAFAQIDTPEGRFAWNAYHEIGHTLRSDACGFDLSPGFGAALAARLALEETLAPAARAALADEAPAPLSAAATLLP